MAETTIEWCDHSINPIRFGKGHFCQKISPGCANCYASRLQSRFGNPEFKGAGGPLPMVVNEESPRNGALWLDESKLQEVLCRKKPTKWFWCDMTDLFGDWVPDEWIDKCFATMALTPQHAHQVLTKRPERMRDYIGQADPKGSRGGVIHESARELLGEPVIRPPWPLPNVWPGVSIENQQCADERIPLLIQTPARVRFLSVEPMLGPIDLRGTDIDHKRSRVGTTVANWLTKQTCGHCGRPITHWTGSAMTNCGYCAGFETKDLPAPLISWVIVGGESGPGARRFELDWARSIQSQCDAAGVPWFFKQAGSNAWDWNRGDPPNHEPPDLVRLRLRDRKGGDLDELPASLHVRDFPPAP